MNRGLFPKTKSWHFRWPYEKSMPKCGTCVFQLHVWSFWFLGRHTSTRCRQNFLKYQSCPNLQKFVGMKFFLQSLDNDIETLSPHVPLLGMIVRQPFGWVNTHRCPSIPGVKSSTPDTNYVSKWEKALHKNYVLKVSTVTYLRRGPFSQKKKIWLSFFCEKKFCPFLPLHSHFIVWIFGETW